jgi:anti-sigma regulatory factor (Ser/Thr protein kinase)
VTESSQPAAARYAAHDAAGIAGFSEEDAHRAGLVATELATNLVKHAVGGELLVRGLHGPVVPEVEIIAIDRGPGIAEVGRAMTDGHSTTGTAGTGLGAVRRLSDDFHIYSQRDRGTVALARLRPGRAERSPRPFLEAAAISVPKSGETVCGDAWQVYAHAEGLIALVADGLGHGLPAHEAATAAVAAVDPRRSVDLPELLQTIHAALRHTRGAAVALADIRPRPRVIRFAGVGNVSGVVWGAAAVRRTVSLNGTLGHQARQFREFSYPWEHEAVLIMYSDGLASHWSIDDYPGLRRRDPAVIAAVLYRDFSRQRDDVTVLVARESAQ